MIAVFQTKYKGQDHTFQTIGVFNDQTDPVTFCARYDWHREISLINPDDTVRINETDYTVKRFDVEMTGVVTFSLEAV